MTHASKSCATGSLTRVEYLMGLIMEMPPLERTLECIMPCTRFIFKIRALHVNSSMLIRSRLSDIFPIGLKPSQIENVEINQPEILSGYKINTKIPKSNFLNSKAHWYTQKRISQNDFH